MRKVIYFLACILAIQGASAPKIVDECHGANGPLKPKGSHEII